MKRKLYQKDKRRIIHLESRANESFWDERWDLENNINHVKNFYDSNTKLVVEKTLKYLQKGFKVLEGGCGMGDKVYHLQKKGINSYGVDFAPNTVSVLNKNLPELNISLGDVRKLKFKNEYFDGYWSLGVIEHFYDGFDNISDEMYRVLKHGGYLFLTVPTFSLFRRIKATLGFYEKVNSSFPEHENFYQFMISKNELIYHFESKGFELIESSYRGALRGFLDELGINFDKSKMIKTKNSNKNEKSFIIKIVKALINFFNRILKNFSGHTVFMVFKKKTLL